jgi:hypothetical protein
VWAEIWPEIEPRIEAVMTSGQATWDDHLLLFLERSGYTEETYHTFSYSPLSDDGRIAGILCVVTEALERRSVIVDLSPERFGDLPFGAWEAPPERALVVPIPQPGHARPYGLLVVGLNR